MTLDKCIVLRIGTLTGCPLCKESHPLCRLKNPTVISIWLLVDFHPATRSVHSTPADNTRKRVWQYIEKEKKKKLTLFYNLGFGNLDFIVCACAILKDRPVCYGTLRLKNRVCAVTRCALLKTPTLKSNKR